MTVPAIEPGAEQVVDQGFGLMNQEPQDQSQLAPGQQQDPQEVKFNPAWKPLLDKLPEGLHSLIAPDLKQWDQNYQQGIQKVHSQYEPYKSFADQQVAPEDLNNALLVYQSMQQDPQKFLQAAIEFYKYQPEQGQPQQVTPEDDGQGEGLPFDLNQDPNYQRTQQMVETMAQALIAQNAEREDAQAVADLDAEFAAAHSKHGEFDDAYVAQQMYVNQVSIDEAVANWNNLVQQVVTQHRSPGSQAPVLMGGGGGLPSQATPSANMTPQQRKAYVAQMLANANQQG